MTSSSDHSPVGWMWERPDGTPPIAVGSGAAAAVASGALHVFAPEPSGGSVIHVAVDRDGSVNARAPLLLRSVSGAAALGDYLFVGGARRSDDAPVVARLVADGSTAVLLPVFPATPLAAWPIPLEDGERAYAVWATAADEGEVRIGHLSEDALAADWVRRGPVITLQASSSARGLDVLVYSGELHLLRWRAGQIEDDRKLAVEGPYGPSAAVLLPGAVVARDGPSSFVVWETLSATEIHLSLPPPPEGASAVAGNLHVAGPYLVWSTEVPDDHMFETRGWVAPIDRSRWEVGAPTELPVPRPQLVADVSGRLILMDSSRGALDIVVGRVPEGTGRPGAVLH